MFYQISSRGLYCKTSQIHNVWGIDRIRSKLECLLLSLTFTTQPVQCSLLGTLINYGREKFYNIGDAICNVIGSYWTTQGAKESKVSITVATANRKCK
jgi:hypothetical protein